MPVFTFAWAQTAPASAEPRKASEPDELDKVVVRAASGRDERRESNASKTVVTGDELTRYGDSNVADVLRRLPGITINGSAGRDPEIRMRGLGSGYTLVMINGEPTAPGFSVDSISPDLIERIEVSRSAVADRSAQAIAGSINVILKQGVRQTQGNVKAQFTSEGGRPSVLLGGQWADRADKLIALTRSDVQRHNQYTRGRLNWVRKLEAAAQIEVKLGVSNSDRRQSLVHDGVDQALTLCRAPCPGREQPSSRRSAHLRSVGLVLP